MTLITTAADLSEHYCQEFVKEAVRKGIALSHEQWEALRAVIKSATDKASAAIFAVTDSVDSDNVRLLKSLFMDAMSLIDQLDGEITREKFQTAIAKIDPRLCEL